MQFPITFHEYINRLAVDTFSLFLFCFSLQKISISPLPIPFPKANHHQHPQLHYLPTQPSHLTTTSSIQYLSCVSPSLPLLLLFSALPSLSRLTLPPPSPPQSGAPVLQSPSSGTSTLLLPLPVSRSTSSPVTTPRASVSLLPWEPVPPVPPSLLPPCPPT